MELLRTPMAGTFPLRRQLHLVEELGPACHKGSVGSWSPHKKLWLLAEETRSPHPGTYLETLLPSGCSLALCFEGTWRRTKGKSIKRLSVVQPAQCSGFLPQTMATTSNTGLDKAELGRSPWLPSSICFLHRWEG